MAFVRTLPGINAAAYEGFRPAEGDIHDHGAHGHGGQGMGAEGEDDAGHDHSTHAH